MIRAMLLAGAVLLPAPLAAQDHSAHGSKGEPAPEMDHCAMGHLPPDQCGKQEEGDLAFAESGLRVGTGFLELRPIRIRRALDLRGSEHLQLESGVLALAPLVQQALDQLEVYRPQIPEQPALVFLAELIPSFEEMSLPGFLRLGNTDLVGL